MFPLMIAFLASRIFKKKIINQVWGKIESNFYMNLYFPLIQNYLNRLNKKQFLAVSV